MFRKLGMSKGVKGHEGTPEYLDKYRRWRVDFFKKKRGGRIGFQNHPKINRSFASGR